MISDVSEICFTPSTLVNFASRKQARRNGTDIRGQGVASEEWRNFSGPRPSNFSKTPLLHKLHLSNDEKMIYSDV